MISGHRIGTAEIEDVLDEHKCVAESAVIGFPHDLTGMLCILSYFYICIFLKSKIAAYAIPQYFLVTPNLPKTRWGKLMRRILRKIAANKPDELGDISTLSDPNVVENIINGHNKLNRKK